MTKLDFIHIGLGKCMSSRLQGHWERDAGYNCLNAQGVSGAVDQIVKGCAIGSPNIEAALSGINLNFPPFKSGVVNVLTSEDLTFSYLHNPELGDTIALKDEAASKLLAGLTDKVLVLVRDPVDWIKSCYAQHIKEGGCVPIQEYLISHRSVILNNLNLDRRVEAWSRSGAEVVILPTELAGRSDDEFWASYEQRLDVSRPSNWPENLDFVTTNITSYASLEPHRRMNELMLLLQGILEKADLKQKTETLNMMESARRYGVRWAFSAADDSQLSDILKSLNMGVEDSGFGEISLDDDYLNTIETAFMSALRNDPHFGEYECLDAYSQSLFEQGHQKAA